MSRRIAVRKTRPAVVETLPEVETSGRRTSRTRKSVAPKKGGVGGRSPRRSYRPNELSEFDEVSRANNDSVVAQLFQDTGAEVLNILNSGGDIVQFLSGDSPICPLLGQNVTKGKLLGTGAMGSVYELFIPNQGTVRYAVKESNPVVRTLDDAERAEKGIATVQDIIDYAADYGLRQEIVLKYNRLAEDVDRNMLIPDKAVIHIPVFLASCVSDVSYVRFDDARLQTTVPFGSSVCDESYSELINGLIAGSFYGSGKSINFVNAFYFASCPDESAKYGRYQMTFMEQITTSLKKRLDQVAPYLDCIVLQTIHAIAVMQTQKMVHGDLHPDNVFLKLVDPLLEWRGQNVSEADFWEFSLGGSSIYLPACPYIVKLGDWGMTCKYSTPMALQDYLMSTGYQNSDGEQLIPNFYSPAYDVLYFISALFRELEYRKAHDGQVDPDDLDEDGNEIPGKPPGTIRAVSISPEIRTFLGGIFSTILGVGMPELLQARQLAFLQDGRPRLGQISSTYSYVTPSLILFNRNLLGRYMVRPEGNIIRMGEI